MISVFVYAVRHKIAWNVPRKLDGFYSSNQFKTCSVHDDENTELLEIPM